MADTDVLPSRGVPFRVLVDSTGVAINGSKTIAQLASQGARSVCAVDGTGVAITGGASLAQLAAAGIRPFCAVDQNGVAQDASTADQLRLRGIRPAVLLDASGIALNGSDGMLALRARGLECFCPVDEGGNATTLGAVVLLSNSSILASAPVGTNVGTLSVAGGSGTYTFTLTSNPGSLFVTAGTNGVNLNTAAAISAGSHPITVQAAGGVPTPVSRVFNIVATANAPVLTCQTGTFILTGDDMTPVQGPPPLTAQTGTFLLTGINATLTQAAAAPPTTWNPADKGTGTNITLSGSNLTATRFAPYDGFVYGVRGNNSHTTGKYFYSATMGFDSAGWIGIATGTIALDGTGNPPGSTAVAMATPSGNFYLNGGVGVNDHFAAGDTVYMAFDLTAKLAWVKVNTGNWNSNSSANPATGTGGTPMTALDSGPYYPVAWFNADTGTSFTANFLGAPPSGFSNW